MNLVELSHLTQFYREGVKKKLKFSKKFLLEFANLN